MMPTQRVEQRESPAASTEKRRRVLPRRRHAGTLELHPSSAGTATTALLRRRANHVLWRLVRYGNGGEGGVEQYVHVARLVARAGTGSFPFFLQSQKRTKTTTDRESCAQIWPRCCAAIWPWNTNFIISSGGGCCINAVSPTTHQTCREPRRQPETIHPPHFSCLQEKQKKS